MVVVYLKNGEKAPMPDASYVKVEAGAELADLVLRCFFGQSEVGQFKWNEVAGYTISAVPQIDGAGASSAAWLGRLEA